MTGRELIDYIEKHNLDKETLIPHDMFSAEGEYLRFSCSDYDADYLIVI